MPSLPNIQDQSNETQQADLPKASDATKPQSLSATDKTAGAAADQSTLPNIPSLPQIATDNASATTLPKQSDQPSADPVDTASVKPQANVASDESEVSQLEIPQLPEIPKSENNDSTAKIDAGANLNVDTADTGKIEVPSLPDDTDSSATINTVASGSDRFAREESSSSSDVSDIPSVPSVPSVPLTPSAEIASSSGAPVMANKIRDANSRSGNLSDLSKFVIDEAKVLLLPNDDVVLGELTETASYEQMDFFAYIKLYEAQLAYENSSERRSVIDNFLKNYDANFNKVQILSDSDAADQAFIAINKNSLFALRVLLDSNSLLQAKDEKGDTLLHVAVERDNSDLTKFLVIRGVNPSAYNARNQTPLMISDEIGAADISRLLNSVKISLK